MDRKTLVLILTEVVLVVALVVVVAMDFNLKPQAEIATAPVAEEATTADADEGTAEEAVAETVVAKAEEAAEKAPAEKAEAKEEKPAEKAADEEKTAEKSAAPAAGGAVSDVIPLENPAYAKHTKGIVQFTHKKHYTDYKIGCGECHHDENAEPLNDLKEGDAVQGCIECHPKASKAPIPKKGEPKLSDSEKMEYHAEALHANCIDCHKEHNQKNNTKAAPTSCTTCHPKTK